MVAGGLSVYPKRVGMIGYFGGIETWVNCSTCSDERIRRAVGRWMAFRFERILMARGAQTLSVILYIVANKIRRRMPTCVISSVDQNSTEMCTRMQLIFVDVSLLTAYH